jgi:hypothetical protein
LLARLRAAAGAKDAEVAMLRAELAAEPELRHRLELRLAELERRLGMDSTNSGMPTSKESIGAKERRKAGAGQAGFLRRERRRGLQPNGLPGRESLGGRGNNGQDRDVDPGGVQRLNAALADVLEPGLVAAHGVPLGNSVSCRELGFGCGFGSAAGSISRCCCHSSTGC